TPSRPLTPSLTASATVLLMAAAMESLRRAASRCRLSLSCRRRSVRGLGGSACARYGAFTSRLRSGRVVGSGEGALRDVAGFAQRSSGVPHGLALLALLLRRGGRSAGACQRSLQLRAQLLRLAQWVWSIVAIWGSVVWYGRLSPGARKQLAGSECIHRR